MGITVFKIAIWWGKSSVLWSQITFYDSADASAKNEISYHKNNNLPNIKPNDNFEDSYPLNCCFRVTGGKSKWQNHQNEFAPSEVSDQLGHPPSLIRVFAVRIKKAWVLSYPLSAQRRLWSGWADAQADLSLRWAHTHFVGFVMSRLKSHSPYMYK